MAYGPLSANSRVILHAAQGSQFGELPGRARLVGFELKLYGHLGMLTATWLTVTMSFKDVNKLETLFPKIC